MNAGTRNTFRIADLVTRRRVRNTRVTCKSVKLKQKIEASTYRYKYDFIFPASYLIPYFHFVHADAYAFFFNYTKKK